MTAQVLMRPPEAGLRSSRLRWIRWQRFWSWLAFPFFGAFIVLAFRVVKGYRIADLRRVRREFRRLMSDAEGPVLICPNHLTMIDSVILMWAFASPLHYMIHFHRLAWNTPAIENFAGSRVLRFLCYIGKCIPIDRSGDHDHIEEVLASIEHLLQQGDAFMIFPEGTRSRTGRIDLNEIAYGVGRIVQSVANCRVLCVYIRGDKQETYSAIPASGDTFRVRMELLKPATDSTGLRGRRDLALQIAGKLKYFEDDYFAGRK